MIRALACVSVAANKATSHVSVVEPMRKAVKPLPHGRWILKVQCGGERDLTYVKFSVDSAISVEVQ